MNKYKIIMSILILSLTYSVTCDDAEEGKLRGLNRARQKYRYNHPPAAENYENIPVLVVYDKVVDRTSRRRKVEPETEPTVSFPETKDNSAVTSVTKISNEEKVTIIENSTKTVNIAAENTKQPESRNVQLSFKIPVSVIYDEKPGDVRGNRMKSRVSTRLRKTNKRQRKPIIKLVEQPESSIIPLKEKCEKDKSEVKLTEKDLPVEHIEKEKSKTDIQRSKVPAGNSRRRILTNKTEQDISKESKVNVSQESPKPVKNTTISNFKQSAEYAYQEKSSQAEMTETSITIISTHNATGQKREHGEPDAFVPIVASENRVFGHNGEYKYSYESGDGTRAFSKGKLKTFDEEVAGEAVEGGFSYKDKDGNDFSLSYTADENGYRPIGAHLPTSPPIPPAIARALAYLATKTTPEPVTEAIYEQENIPVPNEKVKQRN